MAVAEAWCVTTEEAKIAIGVPTTPQPEGILAFNAHRIYGTLNYPYLVIKPSNNFEMMKNDENINVCR